MTAQQCLALAALRRWLWERGALLRGHATPALAPRGRKPVNAQERTRNIWEGAMIRTIDFGRCFDLLSEEHRAVLLAVYRENLGDKVAAELLDRSARWVSYTKDDALAALAELLDARALL